MIVLGVDQAKVSGWAIMSGPRLMHSGIARTAQERHQVVNGAVVCAGEAVGQLWLWLEDHTDTVKHALSAARRGERPKTSTAAVLSLGAARGQWLQAYEHAGGRHRAMAKPAEWRARVLGKDCVRDRDKAKNTAIAWARHCYGVTVTHDEAEAIAIAHYGMTRLRLQQ